MSSDSESEEPRDKSAESAKASWWVETIRSNEASALMLFGLSAMLFLALRSFEPEYLPSWIPWAMKPEVATDGGNLVGPIGAVTAGSLLALFGAAAYLLPLVLIWWAVQFATTGRVLRVRNHIALGMFLLAAACMVDCQNLFFRDWVDRYQLHVSAGGVTGAYLSHYGLVRLFGPGGTFIIMSVVAFVTLIVITGIHPFRMIGHLCRGIDRFFRGIDWENKWSLWSGMRARNNPYSVGPSVSTPRMITVRPIITEDVIEEGSSIPIEAREIRSETGDGERLRRIIDSTQKHHRSPSDKGVEAMANQVTMSSQSRFADYQLPPLDLLSYFDDFDNEGTDDETLIEIQNEIVATLNSFKVEVEPGDITKGPTITRYEVYPSPGLRVNKITTLKADIARATRAERINILAPIPGKDTVGIEIANPNKVTVSLRELFESDAFVNSTAKLPLVLGKDVYGNTIIGDLSRMPHLLVAGATGSGKSVCINAIIASLLYRFTPDELKFIMIDPKVVEMQLYNELPHMVIPVVTEPKKVLMALRWVIREMESRYEMFAKKGVRNFEGYNSLRAREVRAREMAEHKLLQPNLVNTETGEDFLSSEEFEELEALKAAGHEDMPERLPYIVVIIDELADLMQTAPADTETGIARIAQKARAAGIHLIIATQTPRADVITGTIKANIPSRIAFQVSSKTDSRIILDENGAENLVGKGDMLYLPPGSAQLIRAQGALITDSEAQALVKACASQGQPDFELDDTGFTDFGGMDESEECEVSDADEVIIARCLEVIMSERKASTSLLQRRLRLGYTRAARMIDILESRGIIGPGDGAKPREVLIGLPDEEPETVENETA